MKLFVSTTLALLVGFFLVSTAQAQANVFPTNYIDGIEVKTSQILPSAANQDHIYKVQWQLTDKSGKGARSVPNNIDGFHCLNANVTDCQDFRTLITSGNAQFNTGDKYTWTTQVYSSDVEGSIQPCGTYQIDIYFPTLASNQKFDTTTTHQVLMYQSAGWYSTGVDCVAKTVTLKAPTPSPTPKVKATPTPTPRKTAVKKSVVKSCTIQDCVTLFGKKICYTHISPKVGSVCTGAPAASK